MILYFSGTGNSAYVAKRVGMACICRCPTGAIEYGKHSEGLPRYVCGKEGRSSSAAGIGGAKVSGIKRRKGRLLCRRPFLLGPARFTGPAHTDA